MDTSAHFLYQLLADSEPKACAAIAARSGAVCLVKGHKQTAQLLLIQTDSCIAHVELHALAAALRRFQQIGGDNHFARVCKFDCVTHQVDQHLGQAHRVTAECARHIWRNRVDNFQPLFIGLQRGGNGHRLQHLLQQEIRVVKLKTTRFDLREIQNVVDDGQQRAGGNIDFFEVILLARRQIGLQCQPRHAKHRVHGCANLMAHVGQKSGLRSFGLLGCLLGLGQRCLHLILARNVKDDAVPDTATLNLARRRANAQPDR